MKINYIGNFETEIENQKFITDRAGQKMSPSDMMVLSVAACGLTVLALKAEKEKISFKNAYANVSKETDLTDKMMISKIRIEYHLQKEYTSEEREMLEKAVKNRCVVGRSIKDEITKEYIYLYDIE